MWIFSNRSRYSSKPRSIRGPRGFTLIELLVVMTIMVVVTLLVLVRQSQFDSSTLLRSLSYSVALSVRQSQIYGSSVLGTTTSQAACVGGSYSAQGTCYASGYGVYFSRSSPGSYILFADLNSNGVYDPGEDVKVFSLGQGYIINNFCATTTGLTPVTRCSKDGSITTLSILFKRPNPDAQFKTDVSGDTYTSAYIQISNAAGDTSSTHSVVVSSTGQISVQGSGT